MNWSKRGKSGFVPILRTALAKVFGISHCPWLGVRVPDGKRFSLGDIDDILHVPFHFKS
jgi:hypothetical protein